MAQQKDAEHITINQNYFTGGIAVSRKLGIANSFWYAYNLDYRTDPSQMSVLPQSRKLSDTLSDTILAMDQDLNGVRWGVGSLGNIYQINTSNVITNKGKLSENGSAGLLYNQVTDQLYIPGQTTVSMFGRCTKSDANDPQLRLDQFAESGSIANGCVQLFSSPSTQANNGGSGASFFDGYARNNVQSLGVGITREVIQSGQVQSNTTAANNIVTPGTLQTYTLPTTVTESAGNFCYFAPDIEPFYSIWVYVNTIGTGNWTLTLHDSLNNTLATKTITNANMQPNTYNEFAFGSQIRALINASQTGNSATYHFHLTSSVSGDTATVSTIQPNDLSTCDFLLFAYRLVETNNGWHPTALFLGSGVPLLCIGNGQYLSTYNFGYDSNPTNYQWQRANLQFKAGYEVCGLTTYNQYLVIGCERRSSDATRNVQDGALYMWDGTTAAPSVVMDVPMGSPYGLYTFNNVIYFACAGALYAWSGGQTFIKVRRLAYEQTDYLDAVDNTIVNPNNFTSRYNLLMMAYPSSTTNPNTNYGVWSWGTVELTFPNTYALSYTLSNGVLNNDTGGVTNLEIGCCVNFVDSMYTSWSYTEGGVTKYGLDLVDNFSAPATSFGWESLIWDGGSRYKTKQALRLKISFTALPSGVTITPKYSLDRGAYITADPESGTSYQYSTVNGTAVVIEINNARFHEIQWGFDGTCTGSTPPTITGVSLEVKPLPEEIDLRSET